jgi:hypothetical protein
MISLDILLDIVCTEAIEHGGLQEVPDRADGTIEYYHSAKRNARGEYENGEQSATGNLEPIRYDLELIRAENNELKWEE